MGNHLKTHSNDTPDMIFGIFVVIVFLVVCYFIGRAVSAFQNVRYTQAWRPLIPIINGTVINDDHGGPACSSRLTGNYQGAKVEADMSPGSAVSSLYNDNRRYNAFDIRVLGVPGGQDWHVFLKKPLLGFGKSEWTISADSPLKEKLDGLGVMDTVARMGGMSLRYTAGSGVLEYHTDVTPRWTPTPDRFREHLDSLRQLAKAAEAVNAA